METAPLKEYEVWSGGYSATGNSAPCMYRGKAKAASFKSACEAIMLRTGNIEHYDKERNTDWGCRLFETKAEAARSYG